MSALEIEIDRTLIEKNISYFEGYIDGLRSGYLSVLILDAEGTPDTLNEIKQKIEKAKSVIKDLEGHEEFLLRVKQQINIYAANTARLKKS